MVSKDGKLVILEDIVVNKTYSKYKRIEELLKSKKSFIISGVSSNSSIRSNEYDPDSEPIELDVDEPLAYTSYVTQEKDVVPEKEVKDMTKEEIAYGIIKSIDRSFLNDQGIPLSKVIPSKFQKYWDGLDTMVVDKLRGINHRDSLLLSGSKKSIFTKLGEIISKYSRDIKSYVFSGSKLSVIEVMENMKDKLEILETDEEIINRLDNYITLMKKLNNNPSIFKSAIKMAVLSNESRILKDGRFLKYLSEEQIIKFVRMSKRGLSISYLSEYDRNIPKEAIDRFNEAEEIKAFDNYIILHYTSKKEEKSESKKHKEADKKRDPIMFGLIKGSRKLYYICDWIDEYCDLTLESLIDKIGEQGFNLYD